MRWSTLHIPTLRDEPSEGDRKLRLLVRAGYYTFAGPLFLGLRTLAKIDGIDACGLRAVAHEIEGDRTPEEFHTPGVKSIANLAEFAGVPETSLIKSVVMVRGGEMLLLLLRGDHSLSVAKLGGEARAATAEEIIARFGAEPGSLGPVGVRGVRVLADHALEGRRNLIAGANRTDYHLRHVTPVEDFAAEFCDLRAEGTGPWNEGVPVHVDGGTIVGNTRELSAERALIEVARVWRDDAGLVMPAAIAPFSVVFVPVNAADEAQRSTGERLYAEACAAGCDALLDDREQRAGVKFKDCELIGIPWRVTVGKKLSEGKVEVTERRGRKSWDVAVEDAVGFVRGRVRMV